MSIHTVSHYEMNCDHCTHQFAYYNHDDKLDLDEWGWISEFGSKSELIKLARAEGWHFFKSVKVLCPDCYSKLHKSK